LPLKDCIFIEENKTFRARQNEGSSRQNWRSPIPQEVMQFWGYKFETLSTLPAPWGETSREYIESRDEQVVNNKEQYCSVVRTGLGKTIMCLGGEVDAIWDSKPMIPGSPINWVELKTRAEIRSAQDQDVFEKKLMSFWIQSFLLGVPKIIVGFRTRDGILTKTEEIETVTIPSVVKRRASRASYWDGNACINFASSFLEWLRQTITDEGVWRIRLKPRSTQIEVFQIEEVGHGDILTEEFMNHRIKLDLAAQDALTAPEPATMEEAAA